MYLHHEKVEVFERNEDREEGLHAVVTSGAVTVDTSLEKNPSQRRNGLLITFSCEHCSAKPVLSIVQHKGQIYLNIEK
jgi:hypothetical protein